MSRPYLSVLIPVYNGSATIARLVTEILSTIGESWVTEIVLVNDGSRDSSETVCRGLVEQYSGRLRFVNLARNFGEHNAVMSGLHVVSGEFTVIIDDDFQNPPSEIVKLIREIEKGYDVVYSYYDDKKHSVFRNLGSMFTNWCAQRLLQKPKGLYLSSFKILNRFIVREVIKYDGPHPYIDGLILRSTNRIGQVKTDHASRRDGRSNYTITKLVLLWMNMFANFSILPLRLSMLLGCGVSFMAFVLAMGTVYEKWHNPALPVGWASLAVLLLFFAGVQLLIAGLIGEYVGRVLLFQNKTPQFVVRDISPEPVENSGLPPERRARRVAGPPAAVATTSDNAGD